MNFSDLLLEHANNLTTDLEANRALSGLTEDTFLKQPHWKRQLNKIQTIRNFSHLVRTNDL